MQLTQLCPLKLGQLCQSLGLASDLLHRLAALEARKSREVGVVLVDQVVVGERQFGVLGARFLDAREQLVGGGGAESGGRGHLAQVEVAGGFFVAGGFGAAARRLREVCQAGHGGSSCCCEGGMWRDVRCEGGVSRGQDWGTMLERWYLRRCRRVVVRAVLPVVGRRAGFIRMARTIPRPNSRDEGEDAIEQTGFTTQLPFDGAATMKSNSRYSDCQTCMN